MTNNLPTIIPTPASNDEPFTEPRRQDPIYQALSELGIHKLHVTYSGSGDSGCIDEIEASNKKGEAIPLPATPVFMTLTHSEWDAATGKYSTSVSSIKEMPLKEAVEQWCYDLLEEHYPGWEINEGSTGTIIIDPAARQGHIDHTYFVTESDCTSFQ